MRTSVARATAESRVSRAARRTRVSGATSATATASSRMVRRLADGERGPVSLEGYVRRLGTWRVLIALRIATSGHLCVVCSEHLLGAGCRSAPTLSWPAALHGEEEGDSPMDEFRSVHHHGEVNEVTYHQSRTAFGDVWAKKQKKKRPIFRPRRPEFTKTCVLFCIDYTIPPLSLLPVPAGLSCIF